MKNNLKAGFLIPTSGILNILLSIVHQIVLYFSYVQYKSQIMPSQAGLLSELLLFSLGMGFVLLFVGIGTLYCYAGIKRGETWAFHIASAFALFLLIATTLVLLVDGFDGFVAYIHLLNALFIIIPIRINRESLKKRKMA